MAYGYMCEAMRAHIQPRVTGKRVIDVGSGDGSYARVLRDMGAVVTAIDKDRDDLHREEANAADIWFDLGWKESARRGALTKHLAEA